MKRCLNNLAFLLRKGARTDFVLLGRETMEGDVISLFGKEVSADIDLAHRGAG